MPAVIDPLNATRLARKADAEHIIRLFKFGAGAKAFEHVFGLVLPVSSPPLGEGVRELVEAARKVVSDYPVAAGTSGIGEGWGSIRALHLLLAALDHSPSEGKYSSEPGVEQPVLGSTPSPSAGGEA